MTDSLPSRDLTSELPEDLHCASCGVSLEQRAAYLLGDGAESVWKCLRCSLIDRPLVIRSSKVALVVGSALVALNQADQLLGGTFPWASSWYKIPLTYLVPFCVATYGALSNGYRGAARTSEER